MLSSEVYKANLSHIVRDVYCFIITSHSIWLCMFFFISFLFIEKLCLIVSSTSLNGQCCVDFCTIPPLLILRGSIGYNLTKLTYYRNCRSDYNLSQFKKNYHLFINKYFINLQKAVLLSRKRLWGGLFKKVTSLSFLLTICTGKIPCT